jgi:hypothetical protein
VFRRWDFTEMQLVATYLLGSANPCKSMIDSSLQTLVDQRTRNGKLNTATHYACVAVLPHTEMVVRRQCYFVLLAPNELPFDGVFGDFRSLVNAL